MRDLNVVGTDRFEGDTLASITDFELALGGMSVLRALRGSGPLEIRRVRVEEPALWLRVDEDGTMSWDVLPDREPAADGGGRQHGGVAQGPGAFRRIDRAG